MKVVPVPVRSDNYAYLLIDPPTNKAAVVDPFDVPKVLNKAKELGVDIVACLTTHHHQDHSGGNIEFHNNLPDIPIYGGSDKIPALSNQVKDGDTFTIGSTLSIKCLHTPCHTQDSICYHITSPQSQGVFTGDTLFIAGCGRFFEGTPTEMTCALSYLAALPDETIVYGGHEYTQGNLKFAQSILGQNDLGLTKLAALLAEEAGVIGRTTIGDEKTWNVFMPCMFAQETIKKATGASEESAVMAALREMKNNFRSG